MTWKAPIPNTREPPAAQRARLQEVLEKVAAFNKEGGKKAADAGEAAYKSSRWHMLGALLLAILIGSGAALSLIAGVARPLGRASGVVAARQRRNGG